MSNRQAEQQGKRAEEMLTAYVNRGNTETPAPAPAAAPVAPPQETPKETAAPAAPATPPTADAEQALRVLKGKYNAEVPRLAAQAKAEREAREKAEAEAAELRKQLAAKPLVTPEEVKEFGEPLVDLARRIAREENAGLQEQVATLKRTNEELGAQVNSTAQAGARLNTQAFYDALTAKHADWREVNDNPAFLKWLDGEDSLYGRPRQLLLDEAQNALDASRVAAFFTAWKADVQTRAAPRQEALESQVTPSTTTAPAPTPDAAKKIWTPALISQFYDRLRRGLIKPDEAERIEQDIHNAPREGRYRPK